MNQGRSKTEHGAGTAAQPGAAARAASGRVLSAVLLAAASLLLASAAGAATRYAANNGVDSSGCGAKTDPCRSISKAIENAGAGDVIRVGPGIYSADLDRDATYNEPGEEASDQPFGTAIRITKQVTVESSNGAGSTIVDLGDWNLVNDVWVAVSIEANGVVFGKRTKGFTLTNIRDPSLFEVPPYGIGVEIGADNVTVAGNVAVGLEWGFSSSSGNTGTLLSDNIAVANGTGLYLQGGTGTLNRNLAAGSAGDGFEVDSAVATLKDGLALGNDGAGILVSSSSATLTGTSAIGNSPAGITLFAAGSITAERGNVFGNDPGSGDPGACGVSSVIATSQLGLLSATDMYWGAATGPGPDPADAVGGGAGCDTGTGSMTSVTSPHATKAFPVKLRAMR